MPEPRRKASSRKAGTKAQNLFGRLGYSFDLEEVAAGAKIDGLTYGLGFKTPQKIKLIFPLDLSLDYGRGIGDYRDLDANVIAIVLGVDI